MNTLKRIIEQTDTSAGKAFALIIQTLILISLVTFSIETLPGLSASSKQLLRRIEIITVAIFTVEYALRLLVADNKIRFVFSFFGVVDLLAILPFYIGTGVDLRAIRTVRLLRLFRVLKMVRYSKAIRRFHTAFLIAKEELVLFLAVALLLLYFAAIGIYYFENEVQPEKFASVFHSLWWSVVTLTIVGYGDVVPITVGGRVFTFFVLAIGLGVVAVPAGLVASALSKAREMED
ncbi:MAG: ion transporter [Planctomycetes bacterium]|nr:ion transporter [Planctomycetota bacterium]